MFRMATRAGRRIADAGGQRLAVNAHRVIARFLIVTRAAGFRLAGDVEW